LIHPYRKTGGRGPRLGDLRRGCLALRRVIRIGLGEAISRGTIDDKYTYRAGRAGIYTVILWQFTKMRKYSTSGR